MQIEIQASGFSLSHALRAYVYRRVNFSFNARERHIKCIVIRLSDVNGPRGGCDKCCQIQVVVPGHQDVVVEDTEADMYFAIDRAADRASRSIARRLDRRRMRALNQAQGRRGQTMELAGY